MYVVSSILGVGGLESKSTSSILLSLFEASISMLRICSSSNRTTKGVFKAYAASLAPMHCCLKSALRVSELPFGVRNRDGGVAQRINFGASEMLEEGEGVQPSSRRMLADFTGSSFLCIRCN
jgi:hypothetical protein